MRRSAILAACSLFAIASCGDNSEPGVAAQNPAAGEAERAPNERAQAEQAAAAFDGLVEEFSRAYFDSIPELATYVGAPETLASGAAARLADRSPEGETARREAMGDFLARLRATDADALDPERSRIRATLVTLMEGALAPAGAADYGSVFGEYGVWYLPYIFNQNSGPLVAIPNLMEAQQAVTNKAQAEDYLARLAVIPSVLDGALEKAQADADRGVAPPDFIIEKAQAVIAGFAGGAPEENVLYISFAAKLDAAGVQGAEEYKARALTAITDGVIPAYGRVNAWLEAVKPQATHDAGVWRLPNGDALYRAMVRHMTDSALDPEEVHALGLAEVDRISSEMDAILRTVGYAEGTVGERYAQMTDDPQFVYPNTAEGKAAILESIRGQLDGVKAELPKWFGNLPEYDVEVRAVPSFSEASAPGGYYDSPALDGSRPGIYWINLRDTAIWPKFAVPTLTYHEAIPGHHMQNAIALGQDAPLISSVIYSNPSGEGWALYSEKLANEMGLYEGDPYGDLGRLQAELHRAVRLVVDTGMHAKKWTREQAIDYMVAVEGAEVSEAVSEIERYVVWPGQALGYKIGMLKIEELRRDAEAALGDGFDIRGFHDRLLAVSSAALPVIEREMKAWVSAEQERIAALGR